VGDYRLSTTAEADIVDILAVSLERWGSEASRRYAEMLKAAIRQVADHPDGRATRARSDLAPGMRSFHTRFTRGRNPKAAVKSPVHVLIYRVVEPDLVEIVRVWHEGMDLSRHLGPSADD
jgi:toxin ParE1/3/4